MVRKGVNKIDRNINKPANVRNPIPQRRNSSNMKNKPEEVNFNVPNVEPKLSEKTGQNVSNVTNKKMTKSEEKKKDNKMKKGKKDSNLEEVRIKKIGVLSFGTTIGMVNLFLGFLTGLLTYLSSLFFAIPSLGTFDLLIGLPTLIIQPIIFGFLGFISGLIIALIYNLSGKITGGIELYA